MEDVSFYAVLFIHSSGVGYLGCFHSCEHSCKSLCVDRFPFPLGTYLGVELLCYTVTLCLTFWVTASLFPKAAAPFYIPTISVWAFQFLVLLKNSFAVRKMEVTLTNCRLHTPAWRGEFKLQLKTKTKPCAVQTKQGARFSPWLLIWNPRF